MAYKYIVKEFMTVSELGIELTKLTWKEFKRILDDNHLNVKYEEYVWNILMEWVDEDPENRRNELVNLLPSVRFGLMDFNYFINNVILLHNNNNNNINNNNCGVIKIYKRLSVATRLQVKDHSHIQDRADCSPYINEAFKFLSDLQTTPTTVNTPVPMMARLRYPYEVLFAIGGWSGGSSTAIIETYDTKSDRWTRILNEDTYGPRAYHATIVVDNFIYVFGGFDGLEYFNSCRKFDTENKTWEEVAPMNCKRYTDGS